MKTRLPLRAVLAPILALCTVLSAGLAAPAAARAASDDSGITKDLAEARLELAVRLALLEHFKIDALHIGISATDGKVTLTGKVHHTSTQELAEEVALSVDGVKGVKNELTVASSEASPTTPVAREVGKAEREIDDAALESKVKMRLIDSIGLKAFDLEVEASEGIVSLRGTLPDEDFHRIALRVARDTTGVTKVIDLVKVR